jgi:outer membrane protein OmpA-like peptidoglycan-associated protein/Tol biopolymer transport system component
MKTKIILISIIISSLTFKGFAQKDAEKVADKKYEQYAYIDAIKTYERIAKKGYKSEEMFKKLGNSYYFNAELELAGKWYDELFSMTQDVEPEYFYRYSHTLKVTGHYAKADEMLLKFSEKSGADSRAKLFNTNRNYLSEIKANSGRYKIEDAGINTKYSEYGGAYYGNKLIFTSARDTGFLFQRKHKWSNQYFTKLYATEMVTDTTLGTPVKFANKIRIPFHEATPIFTKDGQTMYFTQNNYLKGKKGENAKKITFFKIYKAKLIDKEWSNVEELPFDSDNYSVGHPALSPDEKTLYFASDMPGTKGQSDIFKCTIDEDGNYGIPENLGSKINTEGRESFPFISEENELYFASDGHPGLGGLDIFVVEIAKDGSYKKIKNIGEPANSSDDDFGFLINSETRRGFLTSNREGGKGSDDIYQFLETKSLRCNQELYGIVTDLESGNILSNAKVSLFDDKFKLLTTYLSDINGHYNFEVDCENDYYIRAEKVEYTTFEKRINILNETGKTEIPIQLEKTIKEVKNGDDLAKTFGIKIIYFDLDKSNIREDAAIELEKILDVMVENPTIKINIKSHTDSRASFEYNDQLSERRAKSTLEWLVKNGIDTGRLTAKGYGERQLVNKCSDDVPCSEDEHQANRRSEFIIDGL